MIDKRSLLFLQSFLTSPFFMIVLLSPVAMPLSTRTSDSHYHRCYSPTQARIVSRYAFCYAHTQARIFSRYGCCYALTCARIDSHYPCPIFFQQGVVLLKNPQPRLDPQ